MSRTARWARSRWTQTSISLGYGARSPSTPRCGALMARRSPTLSLREPRCGWCGCGRARACQASPRRGTPCRRRSGAAPAARRRGRSQLGRTPAGWRRRRSGSRRALPQSWRLPRSAAPRGCACATSSCWRRTTRLGWMGRGRGCYRRHARSSGARQKGHWHWYVYRGPPVQSQSMCGGGASAWPCARVGLGTSVAQWQENSGERRVGFTEDRPTAPC